MITWNNLDTYFLSGAGKDSPCKSCGGNDRRKGAERVKNTVCRWQRDLFTTMQQSG